MVKEIITAHNNKHATLFQDSILKFICREIYKGRTLSCFSEKYFNGVHQGSSRYD